MADRSKQGNARKNDALAVFLGKRIVLPFFLTFMRERMKKIEKIFYFFEKSSFLSESFIV